MINLENSRDLKNVDINDANKYLSLQFACLSRLIVNTLQEQQYPCRSPVVYIFNIR